MQKDIGLNNGLMTKTNNNVEHFEALGNVWSALLGDPEVLLKNLPSGIQNASVKYKEEKYVGLLESNNKDMQVLHTIEIQDDANVYLSSTPFLKGIDNNLLLQDNYTWENGAEGEFSCVLESELEDVSFSFFNPQYVSDLKKYKVNTVQNVSLSAVAYSLNKLEEQQHKIDKGGTYDFFLNEFLKENPNKTEADFEAPVFKITAEHFRMFCQGGYSLEYEAVGQIEDIEKVSLFDNELTVLKVNFLHNDSDLKFLVNVYVSKETLGDYVPKIGDGIHSYIWLCGWFK